MGAFSSSHSTISTPIEFSRMNSKDYSILLYNHQLFSCAYFKENKTFLMFFLPSAALKNQESITINMDINTLDSTIQTTAVFTQFQNNFCIQNISQPKSIKIHANCQLMQKSRTPYVGIRNLGLTCYINSSLQLLFSCSPFVQLIFDSETDKDGVTSFLQKVFIDLSTSRKAISISTFVHSFGNFFHMIASEQDAHEFITALLDKVDTEMGKDFVAVREEVMGVVETRVLECRAAKMRKEIDENSNEIQVTVSGFSNLMDSLRDLTATEVLTGANKWDTGSELGKQEAKRYVRYKKLPKVLLFQLIRFAYNKTTGRVEEVKSFFECPNELDMREFCLPEVDKTKYTLTAVLSHRGDPMSGHYITYAQPRHDGEWYVFNDSVVTHVSFDEVRKTFGGPKTLMKNLLSCIGYGSFISYIVAYVRNDQLKCHANVPATIAPYLTDTITVKLITKENINKERNSIKAKSVAKTDKIKEIFDDLQEDVNFFVEYPGLSAIQGPFDPDTECGSVLVPGVKSTAFALPKTAGDFPVFVLSGGVYSIMSAKDVLEKYKEETLICNHRVVTEESDIFKGAIISVSPNVVKLSFAQKELEVFPETSYLDLQEKISSKNPERVLFTSCMEPLLPLMYPTAQSISGLPNLGVSILPLPATVASLDMYQRLVVVFYDAAHKSRVVNVWVPLKSSYQCAASQLKEMFNITTGEVVLSSYSTTEISRIHASGDIIREFRLRGDLVERSIAYSVSAVKEIFKENKKASIEVRVSVDANGVRKYSTKGFIRVSGKDTGETIAKEVGVTDPSSFLVRSARDPYIANTFAAKTKMEALFGTILNGAFSDRPVIIIRQRTKKGKQ